ncbi:MAG: hypothetical protein ABSD88_13400 [Candidatus Korobacteraceae bacterium]|jgi:hypothetical protein
MRNSLHLKRLILLALAGLVLGPWPARAQYTGEAKSSRLRAVGVLRIDAKGKARLFPVVVFRDGKYFDASLYDANPVPFAIAGDILYQAEKDGHTEGYFTVHTAMHTPTQWWAEGLWRTAPPPAPPGKPKPAAKNRDSDLPVLHRPSAKAAETDTAKAADADPDRPVLRRPSSSETTAEKAASGERRTGRPVGDDRAERVEAQDPNRPTLRRGKPAQEMEADIPTGGQGRTAIASEFPAASAGDKVLLAIADMGNIEAHPYAYSWKEGERERDLATLQGLAAEAIRQAARERAYLRGIDAGKLAGVEVYALDPDHSNRPIEILSATVVGAQNKSWLPAGSVPRSGLQLKLLLVARKNTEGKLNRIFSMISDPLMLDVRPSLSFLGAVDADGSGRAQLLFQQQVDTKSFNYVLYRATPYDLIKTFETAPAQR